MKRVLLPFFLFLAFQQNLYSNVGNNSPVDKEFSSVRVSDIKELTNGRDETFILWENSSTHKNELPQVFIQKVDAIGLTPWAAQVELTSGPKRIQNSHKIIDDGKGGLIIVWEERSVDNEETDIYAQHIDSLGTKLWGTVGAIICSATGSQIEPYIAADPTGGIFVVWSDSRNDLTANNWDIYGQRLNAEGKILWQEDGVPISTDLKDEFVGKILPDSKGGITIIWNKVVTSMLENEEGYEFYFRKLAADGHTRQTLFSENFLTLPAGTNNYDIAGEILSDGSDGFFLGLTAQTGEEDNSLFVQHVLADGTPAFACNLGLLVNSSIKNLKDIDLKADSAGNITVNVVRNQNDSLLTYTHVIDSTGNIVLIDSKLKETASDRDVPIIIPDHAARASHINSEPIRPPAIQTSTDPDLQKVKNDSATGASDAQSVESDYSFNDPQPLFEENDDTVSEQSQTVLTTHTEILLEDAPRTSNEPQIAAGLNQTRTKLVMSDKIPDCKILNEGYHAEAHSLAGYFSRFKINLNTG